ncbi:Motile sperm domain-containing protein 3 [Myotis davidii]|uniref:Motile sperm domain-containing protein 3 n=1 Tax=Myotis davidii TaxID=225400 RepID=L5LVR1_MYODS|nr:Motile sperm domain-containing protein 3 [Myotis davidii]
MAETKPPWPMTEAVWRKYPNGLGGGWQPRSTHKLIDRCCDQKVRIVAKPKEARPDLREGSEAQVPQIQVSAGQAVRAAPEETPGQAESGPSRGGIPDARKGRDLVERGFGRSGDRAGLGSRKGPGLPVLCTAPDKYTVFDAEGYVKPHSCIDIVIRHVAPTASHYDVQDRFRIELFEEGAEGRVLGRKDITSVLRAPAYPLELQGQPDSTPHPGPPSWTAPPTTRHLPEKSHPQLATSSFLLFLLTGIVSVAFLLLPLQDELGSQLPRILHVSLGQKLVAAYILGLLTMVFIRT